MDTVRVIEVVETTLTRRGNGKDAPIRIITQYWSKDGELLAERDPSPDEDRTITALQHQVAAMQNASITGGGTPYRECSGSALALAKQFHETYERLAPSFGYETRPETRTFDPDSPNGRLMVAVCREIMAQNAKANGRETAKENA